MASPPRKKRKKPSGKTKKQTNNKAGTRSKSRASTTNKRGPYRKFTADQKELRDGLIDNAARKIIKARATNPKNQPDKAPRVPRGMYKEEADKLDKFAPALEVTQDDLENRVRAIDAAASKSTIAATEATAASGAADSAAPALSPVHKSTKISPSDSNTTSNSDLPPRKTYIAR